MRRDDPALPCDPLALTRALIACDSRNPAFAADAPGESAVAEVLAAALRAWGFTVDIIPVRPGRPNVVARIGAARGGRSLLLNGHLDTVGVTDMVHPPFDPVERAGRLYGRGSADMKAGIASMCVAAARAAARGIAGEVIVTAVIDEEWHSVGTSDLIARGIRADAAIVTEPTRLAICPAHKGFAWADIEVEGRAAHGSRYDIGVDAITHAAHILTALDAYQRDVLVHRTHPLLGRGSLHAGTIEAPGNLSAYPAWTRIGIERRTLPGEGADQTVREITDAIAQVQARVPELRATVAPGLVQPPNDVARDHPIVEALLAAAARCGRPAPIEGLACWTDAALLSGAGIPAICFGPGDIGLAHAAEEYVPVDEIHHATDILTELICTWCAAPEATWAN